MPLASQTLLHLIPSASFQGKRYHLYFVGKEIGFKGVN